MQAHRRLALFLLAFPTAASCQMPPDPGPSLQPPAPPLQQMLTLPATAASSAPAPRKQPLPTVTIREFRSSVGEVTPRGATDMFMSALVKTRRFRVLERARLAEGVAAEKGLNQQGLTTGQSGQTQFLGATYLFEATISEASAGDSRSSLNLGLAGATAGQAWTSDTIAIDVRVIEIDSGVVVDAIDVRKAIKTTETRVGGLFSALSSVVTRGRGSEVANALAPTDEYTRARKDSIDKALREAIEEAVNVIAKRLGTEL
jgi:curli biogenesis system outer membrane secretion channel CsgG